MGYPNVNQMLREMTAVQWLEWQAFMELSAFPFDQRRADLRTADLLSSLWNIALGKAGSKERREPHQFWRKWGDEPDPTVAAHAPGKTLLDRARSSFNAMKDYMLAGNAKPKP